MRRELQVEAGVPLTFSNDREVEWNFGDGSPVVLRKREIAHGFQRAGKFVVRATVGSAVAEETVVLVSPRPTAHLVASDADWAVLFLEAAALSTAIDVAERSVGAEGVQRWLEVHPVEQWSFEQLEAGTDVLDRSEGLAVWGWADSPGASLSSVGVLDEARALRSLEEWLLKHEWSKVNAIQGLHRFERESRALDVFADRGALHAIESSYRRRQPGAHARVLASSPLGLAADARIAHVLDALPTGTVQTFVRPEMTDVTSMTGAVRFRAASAAEPETVVWEGHISASAPLWSADAGPSVSLLADAGQGALLAVSLPDALQRLAALVPALPDDEDFPELRPGLAGLQGGVELLVYPDVEGFIRDTLGGDGPPRPRFSFRMASTGRPRGLEQQKQVLEFIEAVLFRQGAVVSRREGQGATEWAGTVGGEPLMMSVDHRELKAVGGTPPVAAGVDLRGAELFQPGHASVRVDLGALRRELLGPRRVIGIDPRRSLSTQAAAASVLDRLTQADVLTLDMAPEPDGARFELSVTFRRRAEEGQ